MMFTVFCFLAILHFAGSQLAEPKCRPGSIPDISAAEVESCIDRDLGRHFLHGYYSKLNLVNSAKYTCIYGDWNLHKVTENKELSVRAVVNLFDARVRDWEKFEMIAVRDLGNSTSYVLVHIWPFGGSRLIYYSKEFRIDYIWFVTTVEPSGNDCQYAWTIHSRAKTMSGYQYQRAIDQVRKFGLNTVDATRVLHDCSY